MNPNYIYRIYIDRDAKEVVILSVNNIETRTPPFKDLEEAYNYAYKLKEMYYSSKINVEVYDGLDEAKSR